MARKQKPRSIFDAHMGPTVFGRSSTRDGSGI
jgi:hypothetical protein